MGNWWEEQPKPTGSLASLQPTVQPLSVPSAPAALPAFDSAAANNPYAAQLAQGLQAYRNRPSRFSTEPASLPAPAQPPEADKPAFDLGNSLSALYEGATEQFIPGVKSALAQAYTGLERPDRNPEWATRFMEEGRQAQQQADQRTAELQRQGQSDSTSEAIRSAIPSLGFSLGSMAAAIPAGLAGAAATQAAIPIPGSGLVGGALAAGAASGVAGYRMAGSQFLNDTFAQMEQESQKQRGRGLTEQEKATAYQELRPVAENTGLWEAGPEAIGNAAMLGLGRVALGLMPKAAMQNLAASALGRAGVRTGAAAGALATEVGTEGVTQFAQGNDQQKGQAAVDALLSGKDMKTAMAAVDPQYQGFQGLVQSTKDVAPATIATVLLMGGLAKPGHMAYSAIRDRREGNARVEDATQATADLRANLEFAREDDITTALTGFDQIETSGTLPKAAAKRLDAARQQLIEELSLRAAPDALNEPLDTRRGQAGYLGFADRANELNDDQVFEAAQRPLPQDAPAELQDARARYGQEAKRRQDLNLAAAHFDQNPEAVAGVAKVLADIGGGKPLNKGGHGSVDYNLSSLSDDMLARYRMAGTVLLRDHAETLGNRAEKLNQTLALLSEETERRASGQRRDPQAIREADIAQKIAKGEKNAKKLLTGLSPDAMERMASGLESRSQLEPGLADTAREIRALANKERARLFNSQGAKQPGIQAALRGWNQNQPNMPEPQGQSLDQQIAADRARLSELAQQQVERQRQEKLADRTQAIQQQEADRRARLNAEIAARGAPGELARLLGPETQAPTPRQEAPAPQSLSDLLNRPSQSSAVPTARAGERGSLSDLFPQQRSTNRNWWDTELSPSKATTETPAPPKSGWTRFGNETGTLNIPRAEMPQVKAEHRGALVNFLNARGVAHEADTEVDPATLKPTQAEFSPQKVRKAINYQGGDRSILVSSDGYVLDGHHQWLAALEQGKPIKAIRLDAPIANLLPLTREFPSSTVSTASNVRGGQTGRVETPTTAAPTQPEIPNEARKAEAEAAPLLNQAPDVVAPQPEDSGVAPSPAKTAKGAAPLWNRANEDERIALLRQPSGSAGSSVSDDFARRKAAEWKTWTDIPEGPAKNRLREALKNQETQNAIENPSASPTDGGVSAQPSIRQEGGNPAESSQGIQQGGQENRSPAQEVGEGRVSFDVKMATGKQRTRRVENARLVDLGIPGITGDEQFAVHPSIDKKGYVVSHIGTGLRVVSPQKTEEAAISEASSRLKMVGKDTFDRTIQAWKQDNKKTSAKPSKQPNGEKDDWEMTKSEWLGRVRFYRSGKTKNAELPGGTRVILDQGATAKNFREHSARFLLNMHESGVKLALSEGKNVPAVVLAEYPDLRQESKKAGEPIGGQPVKEQASEDISRENWWDKELTRKGRENALVAAGLRLNYDKVKWRHLKDDVRARLARIIGTDRDPAIADPASPQTQNITNTPAGPATTRPAGPGTTAIELPVGAGERPAPQAATDYGKSNTIFTEDAAAKARAILKAKLGQLSAGIDPEIIQAGITLAGYHIEAGAREFSAYAKAMLADLGEQARPFLRSWYEGVRHYPGFSNDGMTASSELDADEAAPSPQKKSTEATIPKPPTAVQLDDGSTIKDSTNEPATDQGKQPGVGAVAPRRSETTPGRREGGRPEPSATGGTAADLATEPSANVEAPEGENPRPSARNRATGPVSQGTSETPEGGNGATRRSGTGNGGLATDDAGRTGSTGTELKNGGVSDSAPVITYPNYHISDPKALVGGGPKARFNKNRRAIETWKELTETGLQPTPEQLDALAAYTGWGSFGQELFQGTFEHPRPKPGWADESQWMRDTLGKSEWESAQRSILNAHYTDPPTVNAMWNLARKLGFSGGRVLEPSMGIGNFFGLMPRDIMGASQLTGIELDEMTAGMAQRLYPDAIVRQMGYQDSKTADHFYDLVIGNWPFARQGPIDRRYRALSPSLHDYFFLKAVDQVRPGGLVIGVTSAFTMDKKGEGIRRELAKKAELVAAFRLPTGAFEDYAGTKVVTDIIILKKRDTPLQSVNDESWVRLGATTAPSGAELSVNQYYIEHPDQVLGVMDIGRGMMTGAPGLIVNRPDRYGEMLSQIADRVDAGIYEPRTTREVTRYLNEETKDRQQSATIGNDGQLYQVQGDRLASLEDVQPYAVKSDQQTADRAAQIRGLIALRRQTNALFAAERDATVGDARVEELRADLKKGYQDFVAKHGPVNESFGLRYLNKLGDPYQADLAALETWNGKEWKPATALNRPTTRGKKTMGRPSVADALVLARNERSDIDIARIAELANTTPDKASNTLLESGAIFKAPDGRYEVADQYLSGNVRRKLREAQAAKADGVEGMDRNIAALEQVIPKTVPYYNIEARMGAPWVPVEDYGDFVKELLGANTESDGLPISFIAGRWKVGKSSMFSMAQGTPWQTNDVSFRSLLSAALNVQTLTVKRFDPVDKTTYVDEAATKEANQKVADLREAFTTWLWKTPDRQVRLEKVYNEIMNAMAAPEFDGSFLNFEGMALQRGQQPFNLRQHQIDAIYRGIANRRGLYAHEVGTGKTYTIAGVAVESRRYGLSRKPLILAHNANSKAVADGIVEMYPNAKVLYINNLDSKSIETKLRQIKMDDWDAVVVPHSLIERFALTRETLMDLAQEQIDALEEEAYTAAEEDMGAQGERLVDLALDGDESAFKKLRSPSAKDLVRARNQIIAKIEDHAQRASREGAVPFEELGIDSIIVDEAHLFKKPPLETRMKMRGLNTATSNRGLAMSFLTNYIKKINGGKGVHLFTGTPITNTLSETFHMMRYVMDDEMRRDGLQNWDGWFNTFASETNDIEITAAGEYEPVTRLASFINVADLRRMMAPYTDIVFADDMPEFKPRKTRSGKTMADTLTDSERAELLQGRDEEAVGRPYKKVVVDSAEMTPDQAAIMALLTERARRFRAASRKERREIMLSGSPESPLLVETAAANAGLDQRLFKEKAYEGSPNSKAARAVRNLLTHYREHPKTTQVVFMERGFEKSGFNLAKSIVDDLVAGGIPRKEIAIVDGSTSADRRKAVADAMNRAEIRVVIGNTQTLGVGVNMQANLRAMHHLDAPWTPADLEQRNGRGHRQGNAWNTVMEYRYLTERIDGRRWQVLAVKDRFIKSFLKADENTRVIEGDAVDDSNQSDIVSTLSEAAGDPRILIINKLKADLEKLHARERMHGRAVVDAKREIDYKLQRESAIQARRDAYQRYQEVAEKAKQSEEPAYLIDGTRYADRKDAQTALDEFISRKAEPTGTSPKKIGQVYGLDLSYMWSGTQSMGPIFYVGSKGSPLIDMGRATILSAENAVWSLPRRIKEEGDALSENQRSVENLRRVVREPFGRAEELKRKVDQLQRVEQDVQNNPVPPPGWLRNGAPVDSVAYHQGKPYVVTGHRWTAVNYSVELQSDDGKTQRAVPYDEVTDAQNIPLYEPHPFVAPDVAEKNRESRPTRGLSSATPITPAQTRADLSRALGADVVARLEQSGRLVIHDKPPTGAAAGAQGWVDKKGVIHLVPANLESSALSVLLHESAHLMRDDRFSPESRALGRAAHAVLRMSGLQGLIGNPSYNDLIQQVYRLAAEGNKTAQAALAKATVEPGNTAEEALSYIVEYADEKLPIYRRIMSAIRAALYRLGIKVKLTPADLRALALSALKSRAKEVTARNAQPAFSLPESAEAEPEQDQLWREFQAVRAQFQERQASQSAFDRWFGKGVEGVNARNGKPLVLYHGTNNPEFNQWDESRSGQASQHPTDGLGFFMTADKRSAARYGSRLLELHAKIDNPYFMTDADLVSIEDTQDAARFRRKLQAQGYDAAVISAPGGAPYVVALRSNQVKLASNDNPTESEDFRYSRPGGRQSPPAANPLPAETMGQAALRAVQDRFIRFQVVQDWLNQHGVNLTPDADVYGAESLLPKVTAARTQDAREKILKPLIESAAGKKWSIQGGDLLAAIEDQQPLPTKFKPSIPEFLHAQHAIERNAQIAKIKGAPKDGSGLNDAQAHEILTRYRVMPNFSEFSAMAEKFRTITDQTRRILRTSGIISAEQEAAWTSAYKKYVPLKGGPDTASQQNGTGPGISVNPGMKRALGHRLRDENIVENIWRDHERAIYLSEKQKVTRALRNMLEQANNQNIGTVGQPEKKATLHQGYYHQVWIDGNPLGAYGSYNEAKAAISSDAQQSGRSLSKYAVVHKPADPAVVFMSRPMLADNEVALYENGQRIRLQLNDELLARAARNLGVDGASGLLKAAQSFNRWLSHAYTGYNPEFILTNVARDMITGMINLSGQYGGKFALKALKGYGSAVRGLWKQIHGKADPWVDRYRAAGGSTGAAYLSDLERIGTDLKRTFQDYQGASETLRQGDRSGAARVAVSDKIRWLGGWIEKMNQVGENALRVATFRAMVEAGHSDAVAARAAGDVTVNFNRKGELTTTLGGLYLFFNPSIQGTKAMWDALAKGSHRGQAMALAGSLTLLALTLAELARGGDDADEEAWKRIPGYVKDRNLVIKMGDIQGTIPIPYGYGAFWSLGNILSDLSHGEDKTKAGIRFASSLFEQFSAIGNPFAGNEADIKNAVSLLPTALKPMMEIAMNRNSLGRPIMPEMSPWNTAQPDSARRWRSTTGSLYDGIASGLNRWTGGNAYQAGAIDISPETLSYLWRTFTGGAGKFAIDSMGLGTRIAQGVSPELREIPVLRKFVRAESIQDARTLFNEQSATVRLAVDAFNAAKRAKDLPAMRQMIDEQRQVLALGKVLQTAQKMIRARRELEDRINQSDLPLEEKRAQLKAVEKQESAILSRFTARFEKARQGGD